MVRTHTALFAFFIVCASQLVTCAESPSSWSVSVVSKDDDRISKDVLFKGPVFVQGDSLLVQASPTPQDQKKISDASKRHFSTTVPLSKEQQKDLLDGFGEDTDLSKEKYLLFESMGRDERYCVDVFSLPVLERQLKKSVEEVSPRLQRRHSLGALVCRPSVSGAGVDLLSIPQEHKSGFLSDELQVSVSNENKGLDRTQFHKQALAMQGDDPLHLKKTDKPVKKADSWWQSSQVKFAGMSAFVLATIFVLVKHFDFTLEDFRHIFYRV